MSEWINHKVEDLVNHKKGYAFKSSLYNSEGDYLIVRVSDTTERSINTQTCHKISKKNVQGLDAYILRQNDVVIATVGSWADNPQSIVGKVIKVPKEANGAYLNQNAVRLRNNYKITQNYLYFVLKHKEFSDYLLNSAQGSANQASITLKDIFNYQVSLPPLPEQKAIASVLSSLDDKIDLLHRQNKTLEAMAETLFQQWFVEEAKEDWEEADISIFIRLQSGYAFKSKDFQDKGTFGVIKIKNISGGIIDINNTDYVDSNVALSIGERFYVKSGSILIAMTGAEIGKLGIVPKTKTTLFLNQRVGSIVGNFEGAEYLAYLHLKSEYGQDYIENSATGSAQPNISATLIESCPFPKINQVDLIKYGKQISIYYKKIQSNLGQIQTLEKLRDTLLPKLMGGEIRVQY